MGKPERIRKVGPFTQRGRAYSFDDKLRFLLMIDAHVRGGLSVQQAVAALIDDDQKDVPRKNRLDGLDRPWAIKTGIRDYHRWRRTVLAEYDGDTITRRNFAELGMNVTKVTFRNRDDYSSTLDLAPFAKAKPRGRPRKQKTS